MTLPTIAFCTTCKGRAQHVEQTLTRNMHDNESYPNLKFVVLDYNSPDHLAQHLMKQHWGDMESGRLAVYHYQEPGPFKMAHAKNMAHRLGLLEGADILVNMDADNFSGGGFAWYISERFTESRQKFLWAKMIKDGEGRLGRGISGRIAVTRHQFLNAGGYDEKFNTWSPDDKDFNARLRRLGYEPEEIPPQYLGVILHNDKMRFREYRHAQITMGYDEFEVNNTNATIANFGNFGCGKVYKNYGTDPIELKPLPTRIFGIGMHKTATTSLHKALTILGYDSAHWKTAHWAKAIWREMKELGRSLTLEKHYALCDLPIPILFKELDKAYPGSKFILTVRDEDKWIKSVRNHWDPERNPFRKSWDSDPFTHKIHREVYGQKWFHEYTFRQRYRRHNEEVYSYFNNGCAPNFQLLNMEVDNCWGKLCRFLDQPVPDVPYPQEFVTSFQSGDGI